MWSLAANPIFWHAEYLLKSHLVFPTEAETPKEPGFMLHKPYYAANWCLSLISAKNTYLKALWRLFMAASGKPYKGYHFLNVCIEYVWQLKVPKDIQHFHLWESFFLAGSLKYFPKKGILTFSFFIKILFMSLETNFSMTCKEWSFIDCKNEGVPFFHTLIVHKWYKDQTSMIQGRP